MLDSYKKLISSKIFTEWKINHKDSFLCSFIIIDKPQFDFYNQDKTITSFIINNSIEIKEDQEIFQTNNLMPLDIKNIKFTEDRVMEFIKKRYPKERFTKRIMILQNTKKPFWNITLTTSSLSILNIKISMDKEIISEIFEPLTKFMKKVK